ncbi:hypothetical protein D5085_00630 [Ectothiorhodospiraceae bacterium BW-2]|nr:hypothetical protein D5085_00630 [Ectothiorhodospiraceae bacterium BW-2]
MSRGKVRRKFINILLEDIVFLKGHRAFVPTDGPTAIDVIEQFLDACSGGNSVEPTYYYGLSFPDNHRSFSEFLSRTPSPLAQYNNWHLEIISPFFADDARNDEHKIFLGMGVVDIKLLLPFDDEKNALCQPIFRQIRPKSPKYIGNPICDFN